ncbi:MAG: large conductance mechanosensitive channel protein MscL [Chitinophagaceae bacterium]|nr:large conductance mechanosensitive channel protein MscL [Chitinophagaceae bacterium]
MMKEFKEFTFKGNVIDLAVGVILGAAFGAIVGAVVDYIFMPLIGILIGGVNFETLSVKVGEAELKFGMAISAIIKFLAIALFLFWVIKAINAANRKKSEEESPATPEEISLLREIRDTLKK